MISKELEYILSIYLDISVDDNSNITMHTTKNWDSLRHIEIIMAVEQHFNIQFSTEDIPNLDSKDKLLKRIKELKNV